MHGTASSLRSKSEWDLLLMICKLSNLMDQTITHTSSHSSTNNFIITNVFVSTSTHHLMVLLASRYLYHLLSSFYHLVIFVKIQRLKAVAKPAPNFTHTHLATNQLPQISNASKKVLLLDDQKIIFQITSFTDN